MDQVNSGLRLPVQGAVNRSVSDAAMGEGGIERSQQELQQILGIVQALTPLLGAFL